MFFTWILKAFSKIQLRLKTIKVKTDSTMKLRFPKTLGKRNENWWRLTIYLLLSTFVLCNTLIQNLSSSLRQQFNILSAEVLPEMEKRFPEIVRNRVKNVWWLTTYLLLSWLIGCIITIKSLLTALYTISLSKFVAIWSAIEDYEYEEGEKSFTFMLIVALAWIFIYWSSK